MPAWIESAVPLEPWRKAWTAALPDSGVLSAADIQWRAAGGDWFAISSTTGGWILLSDSERAELAAAMGRTVPECTSPLLIDAWRRGLIEVDGRTVVADADWSAAVDATRAHYGLVLILNSGCNLACTYCYLGHSAPTRTHDLDRTVAEAAIRSALNRPEELVIIDFGEIAAATALFYRLAEYAEHQAATVGKRLRIAIQTNATTLNDKLIEFLAARDSILGVSIDGPEDIHDLARPTRGGRGTHRSVIAALARCRQARLPYHLIVTVGAHNVRYPDAVLDQIDALAPKTFLCKPILAHGEAQTAWDAVGANDADIAAFLRRSIERAATAGLAALDQSATKFLARLLGESTGWRESCTSRNCSSGRNLHVLSARGEVHACPRFVEPGHGTPVTAGSVDLILSRKIDIVDDALHAPPVSCAHCPWLRSCGGGCTLSGQPGRGGRIPLPDLHCTSYLAQHDALVEHVLPALISGALALDGPLAGARVRVRAEHV